MKNKFMHDIEQAGVTLKLKFVMLYIYKKNFVIMTT